MVTVVIYDGSGPIVVRAVTVSGTEDLVNQHGPFTGTIEVPAGPGFVTVDAAGALVPATSRPQADHRGTADLGATSVVSTPTQIVAPERPRRHGLNPSDASAASDEVELRGIEPLASTVRLSRSTN